MRPFSLTRRSILSISARLSSSLRLRRAAWLVQVPWVYSGMCTPCSHASPLVDLDEPVDEGRAAGPQRLHLGALSTRPASKVSSMW